jgi:hypothetical protein
VVVGEKRHYFLNLNHTNLGGWIVERVERCRLRLQRTAVITVGAVGAAGEPLEMHLRQCSGGCDFKGWPRRLPSGGLSLSGVAVERAVVERVAQVAQVAQVGL